MGENTNLKGWFEELDLTRRKRLMEAIVALDKSRRVDYTSGLGLDVAKGIKGIMSELCANITKSEPIFKGTLVQCGSSYNGTKVGMPDEMDFAFHWDLSDTKSPEISRVSLQALSSEDPNPHSIVPLNGLTMVVHTDQRYVRDPGISKDIESFELHRVFRGIVTRVLEETVLPDHWQFGGFDQPGFSGLRYNGPALMLQFVHKNPQMEEQLDVSVDFVLAVDLSDFHDSADLFSLSRPKMGPEWQQGYMRAQGFLENIFVKIYEGFVMETAFAERMWLSRFSSDHPVKVAIRVCKILNSEVFVPPEPHMLRARFRDEEDSSKMLKVLVRLNGTVARHRQKRREGQNTDVQTTATRLFRHAVRDLQWHDVLASVGQRFIDNGENIGYRPYVKSYMFQSFVLSLLALRCTEDPSVDDVTCWGLEDIPAIVTNVLMMMQAALVEVKFSRQVVQLESEGRIYSAVTPLSAGGDIYSIENVEQHIHSIVCKIQELAGDSDNPITMDSHESLTVVKLVKYMKCAVPT